MPEPKNIYVYTIGCQMNVYDSDQMVAGLAISGYVQVDAPEKADVIIVNTCTIRAKAEQKAFSFLGRMAELKKKKAHLIIGVAGCVAQQEGERIFKRMPHVDLIVGTQAIVRLPQLIQKIESKRCRIVDVAMDQTAIGNNDRSMMDAGQGITRFVTIMTGCDNYCTYCVVPYVRGREASRPPDEIIKEIEALVAAGVREVTLLGQNVNSYGLKEGYPTFAVLLQQINTIDGLQRIRFTTSHPKDLSEDLMQAFASLPKLCRHIHLPVQSGSDRILKRMNRKYTIKAYLAKIAQLRDLCPDIEITTDIIVGFPGESQADFDATIELIQTVGYDSLFVFNYSDRPQTPASKFSNKVPESLSNQRLQTVLKLQEQIARAKHESLVSTEKTIMVEGYSKRHEVVASAGRVQSIEWTGRTDGQRIVNFDCPDKTMCDQIRPGILVKVKIEKAMSHSLWGRMVPFKAQAGALKGERNYAA